jgi:hypothetical protein
VTGPCGHGETQSFKCLERARVKLEKSEAAITQPFSAGDSRLYAEFDFNWPTAPG